MSLNAADVLADAGCREAPEGIRGRWRQRCLRFLQAATCLRHAGVKAEDADAAASKLGSSAQDASGQGRY